MTLEIRTAARSPKVRLELAGELDSSTAPQLEQAIAAAVDPAVTTLVLDLGGLSFVSSAGLRIFAMAQRTMKGQGGTSCFVNPSDQVKRVFGFVKAVKLSDVFENDADLDRHLEMLQNPPGS